MLREPIDKNHPYKVIIDVIHHFPLSTKFFHWLLKDELVIHFLLDKMHHNLVERIAEYKYKDQGLFSIRAQFKPSIISKDFADALAATLNSSYSKFIPYLEKLEKREISQSIEGSSYTIISQFYFNNQICGESWEIYDLEALTQTYNSRKAHLDPLPSQGY